MIAYNLSFLRNIALLKSAGKWHRKNLISDKQMAVCNEKFKTDFFSPNLFIKIALFLLTCIMIGGFNSLYFVIFDMASPGSGNSFWIFSCSFFFIVCLVSLELFARKWNCYRSGIDEALLYSGLGYLITSLSLMMPNSMSAENSILLVCILSFPFLLAAAVRYTDSTVTLSVVLCFYMIFFLLIGKLGSISKMLMPFAFMGISVLIYFFTVMQKRKEHLFLWKKCFSLVQWSVLMIFYISCNYYVVRESSIEFFDMQIGEGEDIPLAFLFYFLTAAIPLFYIWVGLKKKDKMFLWSGLLLVAAASFTFKYYFSLGHPEIILTLAGTVMVVVAYVSMRYLKGADKHGLTLKEEEGDDNFLKTNAEAFAIAQAFSTPAADVKGSSADFGGGEFGGGGAGEKY